MMINWRSMMGLQVWRGLGIFVNFVERFRLFQLHGWPEGCEHVEGDVPEANGLYCFNSGIADYRDQCFYFF